MQHFIATFSLLLLMLGSIVASPLSFPTRSRAATDNGMEVRVEISSWEPAETALILCDFWDSHTCKRAVDRVNEMAPRMAAVVAEARKKGMLVIHAPSDCMKYYEGNPARLRAQNASAIANPPKEIGSWQYWKNDEEKAAGYPIDATDGGSDDTPAEKEAWTKQLAAEGRDAKLPWRKEHPTISLDESLDAISDKGAEIWNLMAARGIQNVLLAGVHANMCICGRSFGLRQLSNLGKNVVLLRDLTDALYNPAMPPQVSHFRGTEMMIGHIERLICPTAASSEIFGGTSFEFSGDARKRLVFMIGEDEYKTAATLPTFAENELGNDFQLSYILAPANAPADFAEMSSLANADALFLSCRRRLLVPEQLEMVKRHVAAGKPVLGIRTASHSFAPPLKSEVPAGRAAWLDFDETVLGGNYQNHHGNIAKTTAQVVAGCDHPILRDVEKSKFPTGGSLYKNLPLREKTTVLMMGSAEGVEQAEPVAWTHKSTAGGKVFYTSLGHAADFQQPPFRKLLKNAVLWSTSK